MLKIDIFFKESDFTRNLSVLSDMTVKVWGNLLRTDTSRTIGLQISPHQKLLKVRGENPAHLFCKLLSWKKGLRTIKHICIVSLYIYLHSSILTYLLIINRVIIGKITWPQERDYRSSKMADEVGRTCYKWDICYNNELEVIINR
jgi:hypothetical protein